MNAGTPSQPRAWQRMLSGRRLSLLDPSPVDVEIEDIAHGLSRVARWNGQTSSPWSYSVAEHSVLTLDLALRIQPKLETRWRLATLLHDAPEYVIGDLISPFKAAIGLDYKEMEHQLQTAIHRRFGLPSVIPEPMRKLIKKADKISAYLEAVQLAGFKPAEASKLFGRPTKGISDIKIVPQPPDDAKAKFLDRFKYLIDRLPHP